VADKETPPEQGRRNQNSHSGRTVRATLAAQQRIRHERSKACDSASVASAAQANQPRVARHEGLNGLQLRHEDRPTAPKMRSRTSRRTAATRRQNDTEVASAAASNGSRPPNGKPHRPKPAPSRSTEQSQESTFAGRTTRAPAAHQSAFNALAFSPRWSTASGSVNDRKRSTKRNSEATRPPARPAPRTLAHSHRSGRVRAHTREAGRTPQPDRTQQQLGAAICGER